MMEQEWQYSVKTPGYRSGTKEWFERWHWCMINFSAEDFRSAHGHIQFKHKKHAEFYTLKWS